MSDGRNIFDSNESHQSNEEQWIALSDLMTGLMLIFMLIAIAFMIRTEQQAYKIKQVAVLYDEVRRELYEELMKEFGKDLATWDAEITKDLTIRFRNPEILFNTGKDELKPTFQAILNDFFPRYVKIITADKYEGTIQDVRIEGHTSRVWQTSTGTEEAYFNNMALSQARTRSALRFVLGLPPVQKELPWLRAHVTANGLSSSHLITNPDGTEDTARSQRVEFHIRTDGDAWLATIAEALK